LILLLALMAAFGGAACGEATGSAGYGGSAPAATDNGSYSDSGAGADDPSTDPSVDTGSADGSGGTSDASFCDTHHCIPNFDNGNGYIVQCRDGMWSHSGGIQGACSHHGGES
jgi:hypothetical protein